MVDIAAEHPRQIGETPYGYAGNNPVNRIDSDGNCWPCDLMGPTAGVSAYLLYQEAKESVRSVFGLRTYYQGAIDKVNNTIHKHDPGYVENVPAKAREVHDKIMDLRADIKAYTGLLQWGSANMTLMTTVMGGLEGPLGNSLGTIRGPVDGYSPIVLLSGKRFGHAFKTHGEGRDQFSTKTRSGIRNATGQFLDNQAAANFIIGNSANLKKGPINIPMPEGFPARIVNPDGTFSTPTHIRMIPSGKGVWTAYPVKL